MSEPVVPSALFEALGDIVSMCADARDVFPDAATSFQAVTEAVNELYGYTENGVFGVVGNTDANVVPSGGGGGLDNIDTLRQEVAWLIEELISVSLRPETGPLNRSMMQAAAAHLSRLST